MPDESIPDIFADIPDDVRQDILQATGNAELQEADWERYFSHVPGADNTDPPITVASVDVPPMSDEGEGEQGESEEVANA